MVVGGQVAQVDILSTTGQQMNPFASFDSRNTHLPLVALGLLVALALIESRPLLFTGARPGFLVNLRPDGLPWKWYNHPSASCQEVLEIW